MTGPDYCFCIAHEPPLFDLPDQVEVVATGAYQGPGRLNVRDSQRTFGEGCLTADNYHPYLSGTSGSLYISELLHERDTVGKSVCVFQYRKLISPNPLGEPANNYPYMRVLTLPLENGQVAAILDSCTMDTLVSHPFLMADGMLANYATYHHVADFLLLTHLATRLEVLQPAEVLAFFNTRLFIPGGVEFGVFPCAVYMEIVEQLRRVLEAFLVAHVPVDPHSGYQRRALSFFAERLTSFLLLKHLGWPTLAEGHNGEPLALPSESIGYMCTVSATGQYVTFGHTA